MTSESKLIEYVDHFEECKDDKIMKKILIGHTSFRSEIENFYDINLNYSSRGNDYLDKDKEEKQGKTPLSLLGLLEPLSSEKFNIDLLTYEVVREQVNDKGHSLISAGLSLAFIGGLGGLIYSLTNFNEISYGAEGLLVSGAFILGSFYTFTKLGKKMSKKWKTPEYQEFSKLKTSIEYGAPSIIKEYLIAKKWAGEK